MNPRCCVLFTTFTRECEIKVLPFDPSVFHVFFLLFTRKLHVATHLCWNQLQSVFARARPALRYASSANPQRIRSIKDNELLGELLRAIPDAVDGPRGIRNLARIGESATSPRRSVEIHKGDTRTFIRGIQIQFARSLV